MRGRVIGVGAPEVVSWRGLGAQSGFLNRFWTQAGAGTQRAFSSYHGRVLDPSQSSEYRAGMDVFGQYGVSSKVAEMYMNTVEFREALSRSRDIRDAVMEVLPKIPEGARRGALAEVAKLFPGSWLWTQAIMSANPSVLVEESARGGFERIIDEAPDKEELCARINALLPIMSRRSYQALELVLPLFSMIPGEMDLDVSRIPYEDVRERIEAALPWGNSMKEVGVFEDSSFERFVYHAGSKPSPIFPGEKKSIRSLRLIQ